MALNCLVWPAATNAGAGSGSTVMLCRVTVAGFTVSVDVPSSVSRVAFIWVVPSATLTAKPVLVPISATPVGKLVQVAAVVISTTEPSVYVATALNWISVPPAW